MEAAFLHAKEDLRISEIDLPPVEPHGLLLKVLACGVCGSDARMFFNGPSSRYIVPVILGHELSGEVVEVGPQVEDYIPGDIVALAPTIPCMGCPACSRGLDNLCERAQVIGTTVHGGMAEYIHVPAQMVRVGGVVRLPQGVDYRAGALSELVGCCLHGLRLIEMAAGDRVLIIGDGPVGLTFLQLARLMGAGWVATSGRRPRRRELAAELGADEALDASVTDLKACFGSSLDRVIVAASSIEATREALELVHPGGSVLLFSGYLPGSSLDLLLNDVHYRELHLHGSIDCTVKDFRNAVALQPMLNMDKLITASYALDEVVTAFHTTKDRNAVKVMIEP
jgi:L-iditol 2-dehydrogenase